MRKSNLRDRRKSPRLTVDLPLEYRLSGGPRPHGGIVVNASEVGLLVRSVRDIPVGTKLNVSILFPKGFELANFQLLAEIVWKDVHWEENWQGYRYGAKILKIPEEDRLKLREILSGRFQLEEIHSSP
jgi:hypothetical protein